VLSLFMVQHLHIINNEFVNWKIEHRKSLVDRFRNAILLLRNEYALTCTNVYTTRTKYVMPSKATSPSSIQTPTPGTMTQC